MTDRIYLGEDDMWYYRVRGNDAVGPFETSHHAERALRKRIEGWNGRGLGKPALAQAMRATKIFRGSATRHL